MRAIIKRPNNVPVVVQVDPGLDTMQGIVGGYIEAVHIADQLFFYCNEEGKLKGLQPNFQTGNDIVCGAVVFCRSDGEGDEIDLTDEDIDLIRRSFIRLGFMEHFKLGSGEPS